MPLNQKNLAIIGKFLSRKPSLPFFLGMQRCLHNQKFEFTDNKENIKGIFHHSITAEDADNNSKKVTQEINTTISSYPESLVFITQKSRILRRSETNPNNYLPLKKDEFSNYGLMLDLIKKQCLVPDGGHTCMAITDKNGVIVNDSQISLRPDKKLILNARTALHPHLYSGKLTGVLKEAKPTLIGEEITIISKNILKDRTLSADISIVPLSQSCFSFDDIMRNIELAKSTKLYNLCTSIVKKSEVEKIDDIIIRDYVYQLKEVASSIPELREIITDETEVVLAALACTHAVIKACFGNAYLMDKELGPDQPTQTAVVYCIMRLIGSEKFRDFSMKIGFQDVISQVTNNRRRR